MGDLLGSAFEVAGVGLGLLAIGYMLWQIYSYRRRAGALSPRAARLWRWRIVLGLCWGIGVICFGGEQFLPHVGVGGFGWLIIPGLFAAVGFLVALVMIAELGGTGHAQRREPDDDAR